MDFMFCTVSPKIGMTMLLIRFRKMNDYGLAFQISLAIFHFPCSFRINHSTRNLAFMVGLPSLGEILATEVPII